MSGAIFSWTVPYWDNYSIIIVLIIIFIDFTMWQICIHVRIRSKDSRVYTLHCNGQVLSLSSRAAAWFVWTNMIPVWKTCLRQFDPQIQRSHNQWHIDPTRLVTNKTIGLNFPFLDGNCCWSGCVTRFKIVSGEDYEKSKVAALSLTAYLSTRMPAAVFHDQGHFLLVEQRLLIVEMHNLSPIGDPCKDDRMG